MGNKVGSPEEENWICKGQLGEWNQTNLGNSGQIKLDVPDVVMTTNRGSALRMGKKSAKCQVLGHFARVCRASDTSTHMVSDTLSDSGSEEVVLLILVEKIGKKLLAKVPLTGQMVECQLDTAACNVVSPRL